MQPKTYEFGKQGMSVCSNIDVSKGKLFLAHFCMHVLAAKLTYKEGTMGRDTTWQCDSRQ